MSDRELLELAAKAAGVEYSYWSETGLIRLDEKGDWQPGCEWNPVEDDGDAFRLAVQLGLLFNYMPERAELFQKLYLAELDKDRRPTEAIRYAIVQAAAQLGATL